MDVISTLIFWIWDNTGTENAFLWGNEPAELFSSHNTLLLRALCIYSVSSCIFYVRLHAADHCMWNHRRQIAAAHKPCLSHMAYMLKIEHLSCLWPPSCIIRSLCALHLHGQRSHYLHGNNQGLYEGVHSKPGLPGKICCSYSLIMGYIRKPSFHAAAYCP